jgi:RNA polymerase sigma-70 factor (ECF subfamily)
VACAKKRIVTSGTGVGLPDDLAVEERMPAVRRTIHLAYAIGHTAGSGAALRDDDVADHAVRLARTLHALRPDDGEATGLLALLLLTEARASTRIDAHGAQVLLVDADRTRWSETLMAEGLELVASLANPGPIGLQAMIAAEHSRPRFEQTRWSRIVGLYDALLTIEPSPTIALGRCVAISYANGPEAGLADLDEVLALAQLDAYPYAHAARAQMLDRLGRRVEAAASWAAAGRTARTDAERTFFTARQA